jgi:hypothetical protein
MYLKLYYYLLKYEAEIQLPSYGSTAALHNSELLHGLPLIISITSCKVQMLHAIAAKFDSSLKLSISAKVVGPGSL